MIIKISNPKQIYWTETVEAMAVDGVDLTLAPGEFVSIMRPSVCGKLTLPHILGLTDAPSDGTYRVLGEDVSRYPENRRALIRKANIRFLFQNFSLIDELTVYENVELPLVYGSVSHKERKGRVDSALKNLATAHRRNHFPAQRSGVQQQRVPVARH